MQNFLTNKQLDFQCLHKALCGDDDLAPQDRQPLFNTILYEAYAILDAVNHPFYDKTTTLTVAADQELLYDAANSSGVISALDAVANTITRNDGHSFVAGSIISVAMATNHPLIYDSFIGMITLGGMTASFIVLSGTATTLTSSYALSCAVIRSQSALSANLDTQGIYFKKILSVYDGNFTTTPNEYQRKFDIMTDNGAFVNRPLDMGVQKRVACLLLGTTLKFSVGLLANPLGTVSMDYRGKPAIYSDATAGNKVDFPPEEMGYLTAKLTMAYATEAGKPVPADAQQTVAEVEEKFKTDAAEMAKAAGEKE